MQPIVQKILVIGGNGFIGSAVCRAALARGMQVTSISSSGTPYRTPRGHSPAWTSSVTWHQADALNPASYAHLFPGTNAVIHTLGTLFEGSAYKAPLRAGDVSGVLSSVLGAITGTGGNPLEKDAEAERRASYAVLNRDAALRVCEAFLATEEGAPRARAFVYVSAEDVFRPLVPAGYIASKREAEAGISQLLQGHDVRGVFIRPSLVYHAHYRPLTSPLAALLDLSASVHAAVPRGLPTPAGVLRALAGASTPNPAPDDPTAVHPSPLDAMANALTVPPIHVGHVAEACVIAADAMRSDVHGTLGVREMRDLIGWKEKGQVPGVAPHV